MAGAQPRASPFRPRAVRRSLAVEDLSTLQDIALIVGPAGAAVAAIVSLAAVRQTRRIARDAGLPDLAIQITVDFETDLINATIHNAGGGVARGVS
jgi:hypothetical protein